MLTEPGLKGFGQKFIEGKATAKDMLSFLEAFPPEVRARLAVDRKAEILRSEFYPHVIAILKLAIDPVGVSKTPAGSVTAALVRIVLRKVFKQSLKAYLQVPATWFNLLNHVKHGTPLNNESAAIHDLQHFGQLQLTRSSQDLSPVLIERMEIAKGNKNDSFYLRLKKAMKKPVRLREERMLADLQVPALEQFLFENWVNLPEKWQPRVGLCDFTYTAIGQFCQLALDPKNRLLDAFDKDKIREAVRKHKLRRNHKRTVTAFEFDGSRYYVVLNGQKQVLRKS